MSCAYRSRVRVLETQYGLAESCDRNVTGNLRPQHYVFVKCRIQTICSSTIKMRYNRIKLGPVTVLRLLCRVADMDEGRDALVRCYAEYIENAPVVGVPLGDPTCCIAHGMRCKDKAHRRGSGRKLLLPLWNLDMRTSAAD